MASSLKNRRYRSRRRGLRIVTDLRAEHDYMLWLKFDDGMEGRVYLGHLMSTAAYGAQLDEKDFFKGTVDPISSAVTWEAGVHVDADVLYRNLASQASAPLH
ncbi:MAG: DUF2442 domain-containing protein [Betaproteobacteria bacterium]|nr:DUF2442 domain-containing protein [Betaproteobacteria bacterium]